MVLQHQGADWGKLGWSCWQENARSGFSTCPAHLPSARHRFGADSGSAWLNTYFFPTSLFVSDVFHKKNFVGMLAFAMHSCSKFAVSLRFWEPSIVCGPLWTQKGKCLTHVKAFGSMQYLNVMINCNIRTILSNFSKRKTFEVFVEYRIKIMLLAVPVFFSVSGWPAKKSRYTGKVFHGLLVHAKPFFLQQSPLSVSSLSKESKIWNPVPCSLHSL